MFLPLSRALSDCWPNTGLWTHSSYLRIQWLSCLSEPFPGTSLLPSAQAWDDLTSSLWLDLLLLLIFKFKAPLHSLAWSLRWRSWWDPLFGNFSWLPTQLRIVSAPYHSLYPSWPSCSPAQTSSYFACILAILHFLQTLPSWSHLRALDLLFLLLASAFWMFPS